jgi:hypothetical protein
MTPEQAKELLEPMDADTLLAVARAVEESARDVIRDSPDHSFAGDVLASAERIVRGYSYTTEDKAMVLDCYLEVILADAVTAEELLNEHRKVVEVYS